MAFAVVAMAASLFSGKACTPLTRALGNYPQIAPGRNPQDRRMLAGVDHVPKLCDCLLMFARL